MRPVTVRGHFGEWLQGRLGPDGPVALVTMWCAAHRVSAPGTDIIPFKQHVQRQFRKTLNLPALPSGVDRTFPLGVGGGASTATLVALAQAAGFDGPPETLAKACLAAEGASDPLMFPQPDSLLWASREGRTMRAFPSPPRALILGGFWGPPQTTDARDDNFDDITDLSDEWALAAEQSDLPRLALISAASAERCTTRRGPSDPMVDLHKDLGALGVVRAHSGSARGLIFAPDAMPPHGLAILREAGLSDVMAFETGGA